jgi:hypothetical protein
MCGRVKIVIVPMLETIEVIAAADVAVIRVPMSTSATRLLSEVSPHMSPEQRNCAKRLWSEDSYTRHFGYESAGIVISCVPVY